MRAVLTKSLTLRGFINTEFVAEHYADFLRDGWPRHRRRTHPLPRGHRRRLENAPAAFMGLLEGKNFGKALVRVAH